MNYLVTLLVTAALVSPHYGFQSDAEIDNSKLSLENNELPNGLIKAPVSRRRQIKNFVKITAPLPETAEITPGVPLELRCHVMGLPAPTVYWLKNGEPIPTTSEESNEILPVAFYSIASVQSILIINTPPSGEKDVYTCEAVADLKKTSASTTVYSEPGDEDDVFPTLQQLLKIPSKPRIVLYYATLFQHVGTTVVLPCGVNSNQKSQIYWEDNNQRPVYGNPRAKVMRSGELVIYNLEWKDMGEYTCNVKNIAGKDSAKTFVYPLKKSR